MPSFADNKNVTCYLNDIYVYLRARSRIRRGRLSTRGRPASMAQRRQMHGGNDPRRRSPRRQDNVHGWDR